MNSIELTPQEQKLLRKAEKTTRWWGSWKWCLAFFLFPLYFIVSRIYFAHRISESYEYVLCVRLNGQLHPLDLSLLRALDIITICIGIFMLCAVIPILILFRERRMFYDLVSKFREGSSQP